jgi:hypothetical protein
MAKRRFGMTKCRRFLNGETPFRNGKTWMDVRTAGGAASCSFPLIYTTEGGTSFAVFEGWARCRFSDGLLAPEAQQALRWEIPKASDLRQRRSYLSKITKGGAARTPCMTRLHR